MRARPPLLAAAVATLAALATAGTATAGPAVAPSAPSAPVTVTLTLTGADDSALTAYATATATPGNPAYRQHLTRDQLRNKFGAPKDRVQRVVSWARSAGLTVGALDATGTRLTLTGTERAASAAFGTTFTVRPDGNGVQLRAATSAPRRPGQVAGDIAAVSGLTEHAAQPMLARPGAVAPKAKKPASTPHAAGNYCATYWGEWTATAPAKYPAAATSNANCGYNGAQLRALYGLTGSDTGAGQTIAVVGAFDGGNALADANRAFAKNGVPAMRADQLVVKRYSAGDGQSHGCDVGAWLSEQALDIQAIHTIAPAARIVYAAAPDCTRMDETVAAVLADTSIDATIINNSYGYDKEIADPDQRAAANSLYARAAIMGTGLYYSTADYGDNTTLPGHTTPTPVFPASSPWVTAVGGTTSGLAQNGSVALETGWEETANSLVNGQWQPTSPAFLWGAGGGTSAYFDMPTWQKQAGVSGDKRVVPDIAAVADPFTGFYIGYSYQGQYIEGPMGGTSLASPVIASLVAVAQARAGNGPVGLLAPIVYAKAADGKAVTTDVTHTAAGILAPGLPGGARGLFLIDVDHTPQNLHTGPGYDPVTGMGRPNSRFLSEITQ